MSAPASTPFTNYARKVTAKLRSRMHTQAFSAVVMDAQRRRLTPSGKVALQQVDELKALMTEHRRTFDTKATVRARELFHNLRLLSADEDPHFATSIRALRYAAYFQLASAPSTFALLNHLVQHAHFLDGFNMYSLCEALVELQPPQTQEALTLLTPRILELLTGSRHGDKIDLTAWEASFLLRALAQYDVLDEALVGAAASLLSRTGSDLPIQDMVTLLNTWSRLAKHYAAQITRTNTNTSARTASQNKAMQLAIQHHAQAFLEATEVTLRELLQEGCLTVSFTRAPAAVPLETSVIPTAPGTHGDLDENELFHALLNHRQLVRDVVRLAGTVHWAPRRLLVEVCRAMSTWSELSAAPVPVSRSGRSVQFTPALTRRDLALFMVMLQRTSFRDERSLRQVASRLAVVQLDADTDVSTPREWRDNDGDGAIHSSAELARPRRSHGKALRALSDYTDAIETLAVFLPAGQALDTVAALLSRCAAAITAGFAVQSSDASPSSMAEMAMNPEAALTQLTRLLTSLSRMQFSSRVEVASAEAWVEEVGSPLQTLLTCPALQQLITSRRDDAWCVPVAQFAEGLAELAASLVAETPRSTPAPQARSMLVETTKSQLTYALEALREKETKLTPEGRTTVLSCLSAVRTVVTPVLPQLKMCADDHSDGQDDRLTALLRSL